MSAPDLATLIADAKGDRSYDQVSRAAGGAPTPERLQQLATGPIKAFPSPDTIRGLARGLGVPVTEVIAATSRSLGLDVHLGADPHALVLAGANVLPDSARLALRQVATEMLQLHQVGHRAEEPDAAQTPIPTIEGASAPPTPQQGAGPATASAAGTEPAAAPRPAADSAPRRGPKVAPPSEHRTARPSSTGRRSHGRS